MSPKHAELVTWLADLSPYDVDDQEARAMREAAAAITSLRTALAAAKSRATEAEKALEFYADDENYSSQYYHPEGADDDHYELGGPAVSDDRGKLARSVLSRIAKEDTDGSH